VAQVASGELAPLKEPELPLGFVITSSGRISGVTQPGDVSVDYPFPTIDLVMLDDALTYGTRASRARIAVYIGDLGDDPAARAREILAQVPTPNDAVLLAVSPNQRAIEVVYGAGVKGRGAESAAPLGVAAAASSFKDGNLMDGLISAVRVLSAGISPP
jgi:Domain of unknown function (DUF5130)